MESNINNTNISIDNKSNTTTNNKIVNKPTIKEKKEDTPFYETVWNAMRGTQLQPFIFTIETVSTIMKTLGFQNEFTDDLQKAQNNMDELIYNNKGMSTTANFMTGLGVGFSNNLINYSASALKGLGFNNSSVYKSLQEQRKDLNTYVHNNKGMEVSNFLGEMVLDPLNLLPLGIFTKGGKLLRTVKSGIAGTGLGVGTTIAKDYGNDSFSDEKKQARYILGGGINGVLNTALSLATRGKILTDFNKDVKKAEEVLLLPYKPKEPTNNIPTSNPTELSESAKQSSKDILSSKSKEEYITKYEKGLKENTIKKTKEGLNSREAMTSNFNLEKIVSTTNHNLDEIKATIETVAKNNKDMPKSTTFDEISKKASNNFKEFINSSYGDVKKGLKDTYNILKDTPSKLKAWDEYYTLRTSQALEFKQRYLKEQNPIDLMELQRITKEMDEIAPLIAGIRNSAAVTTTSNRISRDLEVLKELKESNPIAYEIHLDKIAEKLEGSTGDILKEMKKVVTMTDLRTLIHKKIDDNPKIGGMVMEFVQTNLLSNISTFTTNAIGSPFMILKDIAELGTASLNPKNTTKLSDVGSYIFYHGRGMLRAGTGAFQMIKGVRRTSKDLNKSFEDVIEHSFIDSYKAIDKNYGKAISANYFKQTATGRLINKLPLIRWVTNTTLDIYGKGARTFGYHSMSILDDIFKKSSFEAHLGLKAKLLGEEKGLKGKKLSEFVDNTITTYRDFLIASRQNNIIPKQTKAFVKTQNEFKGNVFKEAQDHIRSMTLQDDFNKGDWFFNFLQRSKVNYPFTSALLMPFLKTTVNILKEAGRMTPGIHKLSSRMQEDLKGVTQANIEAFEKGDLTKADLTGITIRKEKAQAKLIIGTTLWAGAIGYSINGTVTGMAPRNASERQTWRDLGIQPYSIKIGDKWYSYTRFPEPLPTILALASDLTTLVERADIDNIGEIISSAISVTANDIVAKASLKGIQDSMALLSNPEMFGKQFLHNRVKALLPLSTAFSQHNNFWNTDNKYKEAKTLMEVVTKTYTPWLNRDALDSFGKTIDNNKYYLTPFGTIGFTSKSKENSPIRKKLLELHISIGNPSELYTLDGIKLKLTPELHWKYKRTLAKLNLEEILNKLITTKGFNEIPPDIQAEQIKRVVRGVRRQARNILMPEILKNKDMKKQFYMELDKKFNSKSNPNKEIKDILHERR